MNSHNAEIVPLHQALANSLAEHGLRAMFALIGDANLFLVDSYTRHNGGRFVGAILMAHGYAQATSTIAEATITHGPGRPLRRYASH